MDVIDALPEHILAQVQLIAYAVLQVHIHFGNFLLAVVVKKELDQTQITRDVILALQGHIQHQNPQNVIFVQKEHFLIEDILLAHLALRDIMPILRALLNAKNVQITRFHLCVHLSVLNAQRGRIIVVVQ